MAPAQLNTHGRMLLEDSPDPLVSLDTNGVIDDANSAVQIMTGLPLAALTGTNFSSYCTLPDEAQYACRQTLRQGFVRDWPLEVRHTDGRLTTVFYNASIRHDDHDRVNGVVATMRPVLTSPARDLIAFDADAAQMVARIVEFSAVFVIAVGTAGLIAVVPDSLALIACGSALWLFDPTWPDLIHPFASAIDTPLPTPPSRTHIMLRFKANWVQPDIGPDDQVFDGYPEMSIEEWHRARQLWLD